ncbi:homocysteine S-methyltransferase family protein [Sulfitobacter sp.]|uniref:homocysteine S-methyltransferase family protein n=1 Tax=Sulfitobacter sp. TaxID=1903071 RepID=UPI0030032E7F
MKIAFTVEIAGRLPTGALVEDVIKQVDGETDGYASYFMFNCAHPDHFSKALNDGLWIKRPSSIVANASRCSHEELDEAKVLDAGNTIELGEQLARIRQMFPHINALGGCCGTGMRRLQSIAKSAIR